MCRRYLLFAVLLMIITCPMQAAIYRLSIDGPIDPVKAEYLAEGIATAEKSGAEAVVIILSTPGGLVTSMGEIMEKILGSRVPTIAYVFPQGTHAASAGFFVLLSADVAAMAPATRTGSAHPILSVFGAPVSENDSLKTLLEKVTNDSVASLKSVVERRGRNLDMAERGVRKSESFTETEALAGHLIDLIAQNETDLLDKLDGRRIKLFSGKEVVLKTRGIPLQIVEMTWRQQFLAALSNPGLALLLGISGILLLFFEFSNPGFVAPGVLGGICILLSLLGFSFLPINYVGVLLILMAIGLFIAEVKVQSFGVLGVGGIVCLVIGSLILIKTEDPVMQIGTGLSLGIGISFAAAFMLLLYLYMRSTKTKVVTGKEGFIGQHGRVVMELSPSGKVFIQGEYWEAVADQKIEVGKEIVVTAIEELCLRVKERTRD